MNSISNQKYINIWLYTTIVMVVLMILIGGITRLTDSGLSMVEWRPIWGFLPPTSDEEWKRVFSLYMSSPEYIFKNKGMSIIEFKKIFFWEYFHRLWGRLIGIVFIIPLIIFYLFNKMPNSILLKLLTILFLGSLQAVIGWWMVKSGLVNDPTVSQYRLAVHLSNALLILFLLIWTLLEFNNGHSKIKLDFSFIILCFLFTTIIAGAFVAGMDAGLMYNEYPLMGYSLIPENYGEFGILDPFENPASAQFHHRHIALFTTICILIYCYRNYTQSNDNIVKKCSLFMSLIVCFQFLLGIFTLISMVPVYLGALHQAGAVILFISLTTIIHRLNITKIN
jgi:cytochrome c oxidase assembly protein subunit 15